MTNDVSARRKSLLGLLPDRSLAILFAGGECHRSTDSLYRYTPNRNYYYLTGLREPRDILMMSKIDGQGQVYLFIERPEPRKIMYRGEMPTTEQMRGMAGIDAVYYTDQLDEIIGRIMLRSRPENFYADCARQAFNGATDVSGAFVNRMMQAYPHLAVRNVGAIIGNMRRVKTADEITNLRAASDATASGMAELIKKIRPGAWTYELRAEFEYYLARNNMENSFLPVITTGKDTLALHYYKDARLEDGDIVLVDLGAEYECYGVDICRIYPVNGKFTDTQRHWYEAVLEAELELIAHLKPGFDMREIGPLGDKLLAKPLKQAGLITQDSEIRKYLDHGIYHFVGLDAHDAGDTCVLEAGMALTVEPGLYLHEFGIGIRVEDSILITETGSEVMTKGLLSSAPDIENFMR
ncbi:MAG: Xaa-Pro aminopeptidase [Defluviitaleaceae bacterium]|nr:Xaa-Pro aminopeptidase [Defluviitaleaceae bacterium]